MDKPGKRARGTSVLNERIFQLWDYPLFWLLTVLSVLAMASFLLQWFSLDAWRSQPVVLTVMTLIVLVVLVNNQGRWFLLLRMKRPKPMPATPGWRVGVATTFVPGAEPVALLGNTLKALVALEYPHDTWLLDEGDDDRARQVCEELGARHFTRKHLPQYQTATGQFRTASKHGNYNAWLADVGFERYDIVVAFDPDHVAEPAFLSKVIGYFDDPRVGYVQAPQVYSNQDASFIARGAAEETYSFYSSVQMASYGMGFPIVVGCHNTHRVRALKDIGGFAAHDADDLLMTLLYRHQGWQGVYVPVILARGLAPAEWGVYLTQQRRWARSVLDIKFRTGPRLCGRLPLASRAMSLLHGLNYLHRSVLLPLAMTLLAFMLVSGGTVNLTLEGVYALAVLLLTLQLTELYRQRFYLDWRKEWGLHWRAGLLQFAKWPYLLQAVFDVLLNRQFPYVTTVKVKTTSKRMGYLWPHLVTSSVIAIGWLAGIATLERVSLFLHVCAALLITVALALVATERWAAADPRETDLPADTLT